MVRPKQKQDRVDCFVCQRGLSSLPLHNEVCLAFLLELRQLHGDHLDPLLHDGGRADPLHLLAFAARVQGLLREREKRPELLKERKTQTSESIEAYWAKVANRP